MTGRAVNEYVEHYHRERNHQGLNSQLITTAVRTKPNGAFECRQRLGGLLRYYHRKAA